MNFLIWLPHLVPSLILLHAQSCCCPHWNFVDSSIWPQISEGYITHNQREMSVKHYNVKRMMHPTCVVCSLPFARAGTNDTIGDNRKSLCFTCPPPCMPAAVVRMSGSASPAMVPSGCPCLLRSKMKTPLLAAAAKC